MSTELPKRIHLRGPYAQFEEAVAAGTIKPGHLIAQDTNGNVIVHPAADGNAERMFALEDALQGKTIADNYASGSRVFAVIAQRGDIVYAWLSGGESATRNEYLSSNGDGTLKVSTTNPIAVAMETVDASDSNDVDERIKVRIL